MGFIEDAQAIVRGETARAPAALPSWVDLVRCRQVMWESLASLPKLGQARAHAAWSAPGALPQFLDVAARMLDEGMGQILPAGRKALLLEAALRQAIGKDPRAGEALEPLERLEVGRVLKAVRDAWEFVPDRPLPAVMGRWALAMGFIGQGGDPTPLGRVFVQFRGRDALHFALEVGARTSLGWGDDFRLALPVLMALRNGWVGDEDEVPDALGWATAMALAKVVEVGPGVVSIGVSDGLEDLVDAVLSDEPAPMRALAEALLASEVGDIQARATGVALPSAEAGFSRLVLHELNNALLPLGTALNRLWTMLGKPVGADPGDVADLRARVERQVERLQRFATESGRLLEAATPEAFALAAVLEEATRETEGERNGRIAVGIEGVSDVTLEGSRGRWLLCFVNLMRNAAQSTAKRGLVRVTRVWDGSGMVHVYVDDDGPGVPEELRERIFDQGVSTRGGTGLGLYEARTTVRQSGGTIACEASPLGGSRFHIHVPARRLA